jgi:nucleoside-diphosphate-sugar epimerase
VKTILLTGGSGVLGQALLRHRLPDTMVLCLTYRTPIGGERNTQVCGDITQRHLGLSCSAYANLAARTDFVIHAAAITDFNEPRERIFRTNVEGTKNIVALAHLADAPLYYLGTAFSDPLSYAEGSQPNAYELSKREAEAVVRGSGIPSVILRPSIVVGDSTTGEISRLQGFHLLMSLFMKGSLKGFLPLGPSGLNSYVDIVPQDLIARVVMTLLAGEHVGGEYSLTSGDQALTIGRFLEICTLNARRLVGYELGRPRVVNMEIFDRLIRPVFLPALPPTMRQLFEKALGFTRYLNIQKPLPSSLPELQAKLGLSLPMPESTLVRNLEFWARHHNPARQASA